jgi:hypothetical protein
MGVPVVVWVGTLTLATHAAAVDAPYRGSSMLPLAKPATVHPGEARHTPRVTVQETQRSNRDGSTLSVATATTASPLTPIVLIPGFPACQIDFNMPPGTKLPPSYAQCRTTTNGWETLSPPPTNVTLDQVGARTSGLVVRPHLLPARLCLQPAWQPLRGLLGIMLDSELSVTWRASLQYGAS